ncbi:MAG: WbqC family protein [Candidatus Bathyarchaeota archaeon]|nr:WbqC family protein [Candidatus Bathyarchaeota archaeon]
MIVAGHQPNYLPYLGFFDKIKRADVFIIEDNVQFERQGFTNRNRILTSDGVRWLTVPIEHENKPLLINEVKIANKAEPNWGRKHWLTLKHGYCKAPYWSDYSDFFEDTYQREWNHLIDLNMYLIKGLMRFLKIDTPLILSSSLNVEGKKSELIVAQCKKVGADTQLAGNGCQGYIDKQLFEREGIKLVFQNFSHPVYAQTRRGFVANLSVVDYLFCTGNEIKNHKGA